MRRRWRGGLEHPIGEGRLGSGAGGSISGTVKRAIDWLAAPWVRIARAGVVDASPSVRSSLADLRTFASCGGSRVRRAPLRRETLATARPAPLAPYVDTYGILPGHSTPKQFSPCRGAHHLPSFHLEY